MGGLVGLVRGLPGLTAPAVRTLVALAVLAALAVRLLVLGASLENLFESPPRK